MICHQLDPRHNIAGQLSTVLAVADNDDEVAVTETIDFQALLADVADGLYESIDEALHDNFIGCGVPYGAYFEFVSVASATELTIRYVTGIAGVRL